MSQELTMPLRYSTVSHGVPPNPVSQNPSGNLIFVEDVARHIESILNDDKSVVIELSRFLGYLRFRT